MRKQRSPVSTVNRAPIKESAALPSDLPQGVACQSSKKVTGTHGLKARWTDSKGITVRDEKGKLVKADFHADKGNRNCWAYVDKVGIIGGWRQVVGRNNPKFSQLVTAINGGVVHFELSTLPTIPPPRNLPPRRQKFPPSKMPEVLLLIQGGFLTDVVANREIKVFVCDRDGLQVGEPVTVDPADVDVVSSEDFELRKLAAVTKDNDVSKVKPAKGGSHASKSVRSGRAGSR